MKKFLIAVYIVVFAIVGFSLVSAGSISSKEVVPSVSEKAIVGNNYNLIANKIFNKFLIKYPNLLNQVSCDDMDNYINKILKKTKIKFRKPDINKENTVKHIFESLLRDYLNNNLECDDFIDVDRDEDEMTQEYVKCLFNDSDNIQSCYSSDGRWACKGLGSCSIKVNGYFGENISWKSSCGSYAYTVIDGENEYAKFDCNQIFPTCNSSQKGMDCIYPEVQIKQNSDKK